MSFTGYYQFCSWVLRGYMSCRNSGHFHFPFSTSSFIPMSPLIPRRWISQRESCNVLRSPVMGSYLQIWELPPGMCFQAPRLSQPGALRFKNPEACAFRPPIARIVFRRLVGVPRCVHHMAGVLISRVGRRSVSSQYSCFAHQSDRNGNGAARIHGCE